MGRKPSQETEATRRAVWEYLKQNADEDGYLLFNCTNFALDRGCHSTTIQRAVHLLSEQGKVECVQSTDLETGKRGLLVHLVGDKPKEIIGSNLRKCPKCGELAHDTRSRFCYRCGTSLLTEKELLKERCNNFLPRLFRSISDATVGNEATELIHKLMEIAFKEE